MLTDELIPGSPPSGRDETQPIDPAKVPGRPANHHELRQLTAWADLTYWPAGSPPFVLDAETQALWPWRAAPALPSVPGPPAIVIRHAASARPVAVDPYEPIGPWVRLLAEANAAAGITDYDADTFHSGLAAEPDEYDRAAKQWRSHWFDALDGGLTRYTWRDDHYAADTVPYPKSWAGLRRVDSPALWQWSAAVRQLDNDGGLSAQRHWGRLRDATAEDALLTGQRIYDAMARTWPVGGPVLTRSTAAPMPSYR